MYPNLGSGTTQPSAPPPPSSSLSNSGAPPSSSNLSNTRSSQPVGFSSLMAQPNNQSTPYPSGQSSQTPYPSGPPSNQPPYPSGPSSNQPPYPTGPPSSSSSSYNSPYPPSNQPPNTGNYSAYSLPNTGNQPPPPQGGSGYQQNVYQSLNPSSGYPSGQQQQPPSTGYQNPYPPSNPYQQQGNTAGQNPYRPANPYGQPQGNTGYQNPYQSQQGGYPPQQPPPPYNPQQQQPYQNPYAANPQQTPGVYPSYNQQQPYQTPYGYQQPAGGYNPNAYGAPPANDRIRAIAGRYEINDVLAQRLNILQQFEIVVLCDDSGSMNTPVDGTNGTRWDELRSIVQIVIEIATVFDTNGVDVHFLNRPSMPNVTDPRQVVESFNKRPAGFTPLTPALRRIFQSAASKPGSDKRLLVFVATDGAPTDTSGNVDIRGLENLMRNERQSNTTYVTFLACTDDDESVGYLAQWDRTMMNVDVVDDYKSEREEIRRSKGLNYPFSFGDYVAKALLGAVDPQMDLLDESGFNNNNNFRRF